MGFLKKIFGKKPAPPAKPAPPSASKAPPGKGVSPDSSSPKEVVQHVFQQLAASKSRNDVLADLKQRGFHSQTAEEYVALVEKTMFNRGT
jgi:hypothetical protein